MSFLVFGILGVQAAFSAPTVGREVARQYFSKEAEVRTQMTLQDHYLAIHFGRHLGSEVWQWGAGEGGLNLAQASVGVTYRISEWANTADKNLRVDFNEFLLEGEKYYKMSFLPLITFPDAESRFPLYFGVGAGLGVFFRQTQGESSVTLDYQLITGARFFNIYESLGFFLEGGLKNHLHLLSDGQINATFVATGAVFTF